MRSILGALLVSVPLTALPAMAEDIDLEERVKRLENTLRQYEEHERREGGVEHRPELDRTTGEPGIGTLPMWQENVVRRANRPCLSALPVQVG